MVDDQANKHEHVRVMDESDEQLDYKPIRTDRDKKKIKVNALHKPDPRNSRKLNEKHDEVRRADAPRQKTPVIVSKQGKPVNLSGKDEQSVNSQQTASSATSLTLQMAFTSFTIGLSIFAYFC